MSTAESYQFLQRKEAGTENLQNKRSASCWRKVTKSYQRIVSENEKWKEIMYGPKEMKF